MRKVVTGILAVLAGVLAVWILAGVVPTVGIEKPRFRVAQRMDGYEIREYEPYLVAEVEVDGDYEEALGKGFRTLFDYLSGANVPRKEVSMTAPVLQEGPVEISMTAPVLAAGEDGRYRISFVVPSRYTLQDVPEPTNPEIELRRVTGGPVAVLRFSGYATERRTAERKARLLELLARDGRRPASRPRLAQYNPPWTPPFLRRNEILADLQEPDP